MKPTELFLQDGRPSTIFFCGECRVVHRTIEEADRCCQPYKCTKCGTTCQQKYWTVCDGCQRKEKAAKEKLLFDAAEKILAIGYEGWVYCEGVGDEFFESVDELMDTLELSAPEDAPVTYAWACTPEHFAFLDIESVLEHIEQDGDAYEDFDARDLDGIQELSAAIDAFNEANEAVVSYHPDFKRAIILDQAQALEEQSAV
jgi:hypothetical protein